CAERALSIRTRQLGPEHPEVGRAHKYLGDFFMMRGRYAEARPHYEHAVDVAERSVAHDSQDVTGAYNGLAVVSMEEGRAEEALKYFDEALAISDRLSRSDSIAPLLLNMSDAYRVLGRASEA